MTLTDRNDWFLAEIAIVEALSAGVTMTEAERNLYRETLGKIAKATCSADPLNQIARNALFACTANEVAEESTQPCNLRWLTCWAILGGRSTISKGKK